MEAKKMRKLSISELQNLTFPDSRVLDMNIDLDKRLARIDTESGYLALDGGNKLRNCKIIIKNWSSISAKLYRSQTREWENLRSNIEKFDDICEFEFNEKITFRGFGSDSGQWIEIIFAKGILEVICE
jgi:hypothetical protein